MYPVLSRKKETQGVPWQLRCRKITLPETNRHSTCQVAKRPQKERIVLQPSILRYYDSFREASWWFQPIWKILVKLDHFPPGRGENKNHLKPPPRRVCSKSIFRFFFWGIFRTFILGMSSLKIEAALKKEIPRQPIICQVPCWFWEAVIAPLVDCKY